MMSAPNRHWPAVLLALCLVVTAPARTLADSTVTDGDCGVLDTELLDALPHLVDTTVLINPCDYVEEYMSAGATEIWTDGNAGGSSIYSEIFAYEMANQCEDAVLLKTETEIAYLDPNGKITDLLLEIDGVKIGVSVTRAFTWPLGTPLTSARATELLTDKLGDILLSSANVAPEDAWQKQILTVETPTVEDQATLLAAYAALDPSVTADTICWVIATEGDDEFVYISADPVCDPSAVPDAGASARLLAAYPNPFNPRTTLSFDLARAGTVSLFVYDLSGRVVEVLLDQEVAQAGRNEVVWRGVDETGRGLSSGVYFYRLDAGEYSETKRMVLLK